MGMGISIFSRTLDWIGNLHEVFCFFLKLMYALFHSFFFFCESRSEITFVRWFARKFLDVTSVSLLGLCSRTVMDEQWPHSVCLSCVCISFWASIFEERISRTEIGPHRLRIGPYRLVIRPEICHVRPKVTLYVGNFKFAVWRITPALMSFKSAISDQKPAFRIVLKSPNLLSAL